MKLEHIGIAVKDLKKSEKMYEELLRTSVYKREEVPSESVITSFLSTGSTKIELLASQDPDGPIARFISKRGPGIHHIAFEVNDIEMEIDRLVEQGYQLISTKPKLGADNKKIVFLHPSSTNGVLIELCQEVKK
ncbi:methylmalonyl-CoA epimerase [Membranihabitans maritimus]|uniref:methylmalonyl-CoA epimerase n=1 Tax=Membranihabitans maritimus TaxID=2904244 RepID=UPI001F214BF2|nr:methylmalonyl-CoA epimerase [Membranihabitans maritimus]